MLDLRSIRATVCLQDCGEPNQSERVVPALCRQAGVTCERRSWVAMSAFGTLLKRHAAISTFSLGEEWTSERKSSGISC